MSPGNSFCQYMKLIIVCLFYIVGLCDRQVGERVQKVKRENHENERASVRDTFYRRAILDLKTLKSCKRK